MFPVVYRLLLSPHASTWLLYLAAIFVPGFYAYRAFQDLRDGYIVDKHRPLKVFAGGLLAGVVAITFFLKPWLWKTGLDLPLHTYGLMMATAFVTGISVAAREAKRTGLDAEKVLDLSFWILLSGLAGARILFIVVNIDQYFGPNFYSQDITLPLLGWRVPTILLVWRGGLVFYGGLIGAFTTVTWYVRKHKLPYLRYLDTLAPSVALGHSFGRLGCFSAGCCWGKAAPASNVFATFFPEGSLAYSQTPLASHIHHAGVLSTGAVYPTQLFESFGVLMIFGLLIWLRGRKRFHGQVIIFYLILYPIFRTINETFRGDWERGLLFRYPLDNPVMLSTSQIISVLVASTGVAFILYRRHLRLKGAPVSA